MHTLNELLDLRAEDVIDSNPRDVPQDWDIVPLERAAMIERGKFAHRPRNDPSFYGGRTPFIQTGDVTKCKGHVKCYSQTLNDLGLSVSRVFPTGTIVLTIAANIGDTGILAFDAAFPDSLVGITPRDGFDPEFLEFYLRTQKPEMNRLAPKGTQKNINIEFLRPWPVPRPSEAEQKAIALFLHNLEATLEIQSNIATRLKALYAATLVKLVRGGLRSETRKTTQIGLIPESWQVAPLGSVSTKMNYGTSQHCTSEAIGTPVLRIPNVIGGRINTSDLKYAVLPGGEAAKTELQRGDILFVRTNGNREYTGRCAVYENAPSDARFASYLIRARLNRDFEPGFVSRYLNGLGRDQIVSRANPAADGKFNIDLGILKGALLPCPELEEQREILSILRAIEDREECARKKHSQLSALFEATLVHLMIGTVRVKTEVANAEHRQ
jgi:type I restriction enzyme, S subunit